LKDVFGFSHSMLNFQEMGKEANCVNNDRLLKKLSKEKTPFATSQNDTSSTTSQNDTSSTTSENDTSSSTTSQNDPSSSTTSQNEKLGLKLSVRLIIFLRIQT
jgi:hypothetical protein